MKNIWWLSVLVLLVSATAYAQKKKPAAKPKTEAKAISAKFENCTAELQKNQLFFFQQNAAGKRDTILIKTFDAKLKPENLKISAFTAAKVKLHVLTWDEITKTETPLKKETNTTNQTAIVDFSSKKIVFTNFNTVINSSEIIYLDAAKTASETRDKIQRAGQECLVNPDGTLTLKTKAKQSQLKYDAAASKFIAK